MQRRIVGFHQDLEQHWVVELACGHEQHVRHEPPWQNRPWVVEAGSRAARVGTEMPCALCDPPTSRPADISATSLAADIPAPYDDARLQGLCEDGAAEVDRYAKARPTVHQPRLDENEIAGGL